MPRSRSTRELLTRRTVIKGAVSGAAGFMLGGRLARRAWGQGQAPATVTSD